MVRFIRDPNTDGRAGHTLGVGLLVKPLPISLRRFDRAQTLPRIEMGLKGIHTR